MSTIHACFTPEQPHSSELTKQMLSASNYWVPDSTSELQLDNGYCSLARASLFNTQLSRQECVYQDKNTGNIITANARLDNRDELGRKLQIEGEELSQLTDGQIILRSYQQWGEKCPQYLLGDFVYIIWDEKRQHLFCARDHFGIKVLFYCETEQGVMLTNEPNAFFTTNWIKKELNEQWLVETLWRLGITARMSPYLGIELFPAAHCMVINASGTHLSCYWTLNDDQQWNGLSDEEQMAELKQRFTKAVKTRLDSSYPLGSQLSEGLDSNGIVGFAAQILKEKPLYTFSYQCEQLDEQNRDVWGEIYQDIFEMLALHKNLKPVWTKEPISEQQHLEEREQLYNDLGCALMAQHGFDYHMPLAQKHGIRTLLSGWGGDHCVSAYGDYYESELFSRREWKQLHQLLKSKYRRGRGNTPYRGWMNLLLKHITPSLKRWLTRHRNGLEKTLWQGSKKNLLSQQYQKKYQLKSKLLNFINSYQRYSVKSHHRRELFEIGVEWRLIGSELTARKYRIEYRYPMLDIPLVEYAYNMHPHLKIYNGIERYMFRRILEGVTTERIQWRQKADISHPKPQSQQCDFSKIKTDLEKYLSSSQLNINYFDKAQLNSILDVISKRKQQDCTTNKTIMSLHQIVMVLSALE